MYKYISSFFYTDQPVNSSFLYLLTYKLLPFLYRTTCPVCRQSFAHKLERRPVDKWREEGDKLIKMLRRSRLELKEQSQPQIVKRNEWLASKRLTKIKKKRCREKTKKNREKRWQNDKKEQTRRCRILNSGRLKINREKPFELEKIVRIGDAFF